jgi:hypothetical protein
MCRIAYLFTEENNVPAYCGICELVWRFCLRFPVFLLVATLVFGVLTPLLSVVGLCFARRVSFKSTTPLVPFENWPKVAGRRVYPIVPLAIIGIPTLVCSFSSELMAILYGFVQFISHPFFLGFAGFLALGLAIFIGVVRFFRSDTWYLFTEWCWAKKRGICPVVKIVKPIKA